MKVNGTVPFQYSVKKWESEKLKSGSLPAEGFKGQVATDGSLLGMARKVESMWFVSGTVGL